jgi:hypothetical protein
LPAIVVRVRASAMPPEIFDLAYIFFTILVHHLSEYEISILEVASADRSVCKFQLTFAMHLEAFINKTFVETAVLIHYLDFIYCVLTIPNTHNSTSFEQVSTLPPFIARFESTDELLA